MCINSKSTVLILGMVSPCIFGMDRDTLKRDFVKEVESATGCSPIGSSIEERVKFRECLLLAYMRQCDVPPAITASQAIRRPSPLTKDQEVCVNLKYDALSDKIKQAQ